jgi:hypothetical protein
VGITAANAPSMALAYVLHSGRATAESLGSDGAQGAGSSARRAAHRLSPERPAKATGCSRDLHQFDSVAPLAELRAARLTAITAQTR